jgi:hypothetical protein
MTSTAALALHYGLRLDSAPEFIQWYVDGMRLDQRGQGVACGRGWIPRSKKCSSDKAKQTSKEAKAKTVEKSKARAKLKGEVKAAKGQKAYVKTNQRKKMEGTEKQVKWATDIKASALTNVAKSLKQGRISQEQYDAILAASEEKPAKWWIDRRHDFRNSETATGTISETVKGYHKLPGPSKSPMFF